MMGRFLQIKANMASRALEPIKLPLHPCMRYLYVYKVVRLTQVRLTQERMRQPDQLLDVTEATTIDAPR